MWQLSLGYWGDEDGATSIEYALIAGLISIVILSTVGGIGQMINQLFLGPIATALQNAITG